MLVLRAGCRVPFPEKLFEEYMLMENQIIANISADKIRTVIEHFICIHEEPLFFILELPSKQYDEKEIRLGVVEKLHKEDRKSTRLNSSHKHRSRMPSSA